MEKSELTFFQRTKKRALVDPFRLAVALFPFFLFALLAILPALFFPLSLVITLPFIFVPGFVMYCFYSDGLTDPNSGLDVRFMNNLRLFGRYYRRPYFGSMSVLIGLLKGGAAYMASAFLCGILFALAGDAFFPGLSSEYQALLALIESASDGNEVIAFLNSSEPIIHMISYADAISFGIAFLFFFHHLSMHAPLVLLLAHYQDNGAPGRFYASVYRSVFAAHRKDAYKKHFSSQWPLIPLYLGGYALGMFLASLVQIDLGVMTFGGLAMGLVFLLPQMPLLGVSRLLFARDYFTSFAKETLLTWERYFEEMQGMFPPDSPEEQERQKALSSLREAMEKLKQNNGDLPPENPTDIPKE